MPLLSIITINYNDAIGLEKTIKSVISQSFQDFEYIIIDGGSKDNSKHIIEKYQLKITYWVSEKDNGIYNAMNKGIIQAQGNYCLFLNSGDYLADNDVLLNVSSQLDNTDIVYGDMIIDRNHKLEYAKSPEILLFEEMIRGTLWHPVSFIKKELFDKFGLYNESFKIIADYDFFIKNLYVNHVSKKHISVFISVFNTNGIGSSEKYQELQNQERRASQLSYFHPDIIESAMHHSQLKRSKAQVVLNWLKSKPILLSFFKLMYSLGKKINNGR